MCLDERVSSCSALRRRVALSSVLLCSGILRRRSPMKRFSFVACRLSLVSCRVCRAYRHALISPGQEPRGDGVPECLSDCGLTQVSPAWRGKPGRTGERGTEQRDCRLPQHNHLCLFAWAGPNRTDPADGDAIFLLLEHVCILILKRAHTWNSSCGRECWSCAGSELRVDGAESDTSHKFLLFSRAAPAFPRLCHAPVHGFFFFFFLLL